MDVTDSVDDTSSSSTSSTSSEASSPDARSESSNKCDKAKRWPQVLATLMASVGNISMGYATSWTSVALPHLIDCADNPAKPEGCDFGSDAEMTTDQGSWLSSLYVIGCIISCLLAGFSLTLFNRRTSLWLSSIPSMGGWVFLSLTLPLGLSDPYWFYIGRILLGLGNGAFSLLGALYIVEIAEPSIRGALAAVVPFMHIVGAILVTGLGSVLPWEVVTAIGNAFPLTVFLAMPLMPKSPYGLLLTDQEIEARKSLRWLRGPDYDISLDVNRIHQSIQDKIKVGNVNLKQLFSDTVYLIPLLIMTGVNITRSLCGISAVAFYLTDIFLKAGLSMDNSLAAAAEVTLTQLGSAMIAMLLVERVGRKILIVLSSTGMAIFIGLLGLFFFLDERVEVVCDQAEPRLTSEEPCIPSSGYSQEMLDKISWLPLASLIFYKLSFSIGYGVVVEPMNAELFPLEARYLSVTFVKTVNEVGVFFVTRYSKSVEAQIGTSGLYFTFASICVVATVCGLIFLPETKGKTPQQMREVFEMQYGRRRRRANPTNTLVKVLE